MYNQSVKSRFLSQFHIRSFVVMQAHRIFERIEGYEKALGTDVALLNEEQAVTIMDEIMGFPKYNSITSMYIMKSYARWYQEVIIGDSSHMLPLESVPFAALDRERAHWYRDPEDLERTMNMVFDPDVSETVDLVSRGACWMFYGGIPKREISSVTAKDISVSYKRIIIGSKVYPIYPQSIRTFTELIRLDSFRCIYMGNLIWRKRCDGDELLRPIHRAAAGTTDYANSIIDRIFKSVRAANMDGRTDSNLTALNLRDCGEFYRVFEDEKRGIPADFESLAHKAIAPETLEARQNDPDQVKSLIRAKENLFFRDYLLWKILFRLY